MSFRLNRRTLADPAVLEAERSAIFDKSWIYCGHESEIREPGDFQSRNVGGRPVIFARDSNGGIRVFLNACMHRGAQVCREPCGNTRRFNCFYHGWSYDRDGKLVGVPGEDSYPPGFDKADFSLAEAPRAEGYKGFWFISFNPDVAVLDDYLAGAKEYINLIVDQSPSGTMEVVEGTQEYDIRANWKLLVENSFDDYHLLTTHKTWLDYMKDSGVNVEPPAGQGLLLPSRGIGKGLGNGHAVIDNINFRGRPVARWISIYGEDAKGEINDIRAELVERLGEKRAARVADTNRNLVIFPNLVINDGSSITIRAFWPEEVDRMRVTAWALGPAEESENARARRLDSFLTFYGPGGFATPDDVEALESVQAGLATWRETEWSVMSRGMNKTGDQLNTDEEHLRAFWRRWNELMIADS
ncbi:MAG: Rieske 2Fe-2S domain-containing protein [Rhodospirillaceae bacterium]|nr:Rieske 2Fe-2S domain-containing protein [Rhodospirillaceae bacterium]MBT5459395.1 Rieske 2Fe-2S domain-containing protein [Rhodospirillaceae bacterium]